MCYNKKVAPLKAASTKQLQRPKGHWGKEAPSLALTCLDKFYFGGQNKVKIMDRMHRLKLRPK